MQSLLNRIFVLISLSISVGCDSGTVAIERSGSMEPSIRKGEAVKIFKSSSFKSGDIVAFHPPGQTEELWLGRIAAVSGDVVSVSQGMLVISGIQTDTPADIRYFSSDTQMNYPFQISEDNYFVLVDNKLSGVDSRHFGAIARDQIVGSVNEK